MGFDDIVRSVITRSLKEPEIRGYARRLLRLQHAAYAVEAALIEDDRIPPLHESEQDLVTASLLWVATFDADLIVGAVGYTIENDVCDIDRLMIDPNYRRRGLGRTLVTAVAGLAEAAIVSTGMKNTPARNLYESLGFSHDTNIEPLAGLWVSQYSRNRPIRSSESQR
jgi:ribosomal protein S18 acetylase RimI-like enzyme